METIPLALALCAPVEWQGAAGPQGKRVQSQAP